MGQPDRWHRSLERSLARRTAALRRRRRRRSWRALATIALAMLTIGAAGALATPAGAGGTLVLKGSSGAVVTQIQSRLQIAADGRFGVATDHAVRAFQRANGLLVDGIVGPQTSRALGITLPGGEGARYHGAAATRAVTGGSAATHAVTGGSATRHAVTGGGSTPTRAATTGGGSGAVPAALSKIARCESGGSPTAVNPTGAYRGKYQFDRQTWASMGGHGDPAQASEAEQDARAAALYRARGAAPWPVCGR